MKKRHKQVYENGYLWSSNNLIPNVIETIVKRGITIDRKILEIEKPSNMNYLLIILILRKSGFHIIY